jgi:two-component system chemotaxis response regulator CheY
MSTLLNRIVALTLVPCLLADPVIASGFTSSSIPLMTSNTRTDLFSSQALASMALSALRIDVLGAVKNTFGSLVHDYRGAIYGHKGPLHSEQAALNQLQHTQDLLYTVYRQLSETGRAASIASTEIRNELSDQRAMLKVIAEILEKGRLPEHMPTFTLKTYGEAATKTVKRLKSEPTPYRLEMRRKAATYLLDQTIVMSVPRMAVHPRQRVTETIVILREKLDAKEGVELEAALKAIYTSSFSSLSYPEISEDLHQRIQAAQQAVIRAEQARRSRRAIQDSFFRTATELGNIVQPLSPKYAAERIRLSGMTFVQELSVALDHTPVQIADALERDLFAQEGDASITDGFFLKKLLLSLQHTYGSRIYRVTLEEHEQHGSMEMANIRLWIKGPEKLYVIALTKLTGANWKAQDTMTVPTDFRALPGREIALDRLISRLQGTPILIDKPVPLRSAGFTFADTLAGASLFGGILAMGSYLWSLFPTLPRDAQELIGGFFVIGVSLGVVLGPILLVAGPRKIIEGLKESGKNPLPITDPMHPSRWEKKDGFSPLGVVVGLALGAVGLAAAPWIYQHVDWAHMSHLFPPLMSGIIMGAMAQGAGSHEKPLILIAEDFADLRRGSVRYLKIMGFDVLEAADGEEAIRLYQPGRFAAVLTDGNMPNKSGIDVITHIRAQEPEALILLTSADVEINAYVRTHFPNVRQFSKPYDLAEIETYLQKKIGRTNGHTIDSLGFMQAYQIISRWLSRSSTSSPKLRRLIRTAA